MHPRATFPFLAASVARSFWWRWALPVLVGVLSAGCSQSSVADVAASPLRPATAAPTPAAAVKAAAIPDSLRLTPVPPLAGVPDSLHEAVRVLHSRLGAEAAGLRLDVLERACVGYLNLRRVGKVQQVGRLAVADMDLPSSEPRFWVIDLTNGRVLHQSHVAHGRGSGKLRAQRFSNVMKSACTALGFYRTQDTYQGKHGLSRRLRGLDAGQNDNALRRYVVLHAADYVSKQHLEKHGQAGYSRGCPALPPDQYRAIIKAVGEGGCLYLSGPGAESKWLEGAVAAKQLQLRGWQ
ncbi:murein L,D-transpeptidase catalytic domain family protein [Hymenobacter sediminis]|uniref:murein L,D-transpeptidase catalytic domain family protein n=1 Tax=Hymenobacter sediminis TaxID=2218621 RepID=UPI0013900857|nr:murein L,D-transpeptidase catalytic domain family protein [Hymenobacter sediminis]